MRGVGELHVGGANARVQQADEPAGLGQVEVPIAGDAPPAVIDVVVGDRVGRPRRRLIGLDIKDLGVARQIGDRARRELDLDGIDQPEGLEHLSSVAHAQLPREPLQAGRTLGRDLIHELGGARSGREIGRRVLGLGDLRLREARDLDGCPGR
jgi:hypothetical protein